MTTVPVAHATSATTIHGTVAGGVGLLVESLTVTADEAAGVRSFSKRRVAICLAAASSTRGVVAETLGATVIIGTCHRGSAIDSKGIARAAIKAMVQIKCLEAADERRSNELTTPAAASRTVVFKMASIKNSVIA